ncbi:magnesium transporter [Planctomicrobium sp. SH527]|uniref:magnesium transporter n=1 Tax=Planctomicrobium sp. SH527 TaxID=3448123 RepID=UPI003F5C2D7F
MKAPQEEKKSCSASDLGSNDAQQVSNQDAHGTGVASDVVAEVVAEVVTEPKGDAPQVESPLFTGASTGRVGNVKAILNDPVTSHMQTASPLLKLEQTVGEALATVRATSNVGRAIYFYVVDNDGCLKGVVGTRKLLLSPLETPLASVLSTRIIAIPSTATVFEACEFFTLHRLLAFPVVDDAGKVCGVVDVNLYTDEILEFDRRQDGEDLFQLVGIHLEDAAKGNAGHAFLSRFPWLVCNIVGGMLAAVIADYYDDISTLVVVAPFIALVTALAESASIQAVSIAIQVLHSQTSKWSVFFREARKELLVSMMLGLACGAAVGVIAIAWKGSLVVALSLFLGIFGGVVFSALIGLSMPFVLRFFSRDPQLASGPMALAISDVVTLIFYFSLGRWLLT